MQSNVLPISCTTHATNQLYHLYYQSAVLLMLPISCTTCTTNQLYYSCYQSVVLPISGTSTTNEPYYSYYTTACTYHQSAYSMSYQSAVICTTNQPYNIMYKCATCTKHQLYYQSPVTIDQVAEFICISTRDGKSLCQKEEQLGWRKPGVSGQAQGSLQNVQVTACTIATVPEENWSIGTRPKQRGSSRMCR